MFDFGQDLKKISIFEKIYNNLEFGQSLKKKPEFVQNCRKFSILVKT